jgi:Flp pilus assembly protein TadB
MAGVSGSSTELTAASVLTVISDAIFGLLPLTVAAVLARAGATVTSHGYTPVGLLILGLAIGLGAAGVLPVVRRARRAFDVDRCLTGSGL